MGLKPNTTGKALIIFAMTLSVNAETNHYDEYENESLRETTILDTRSNEVNYIQEKYSSVNFNYDSDLLTQMSFMELISSFSKEQKDMDPEFLGYLNEFESIAGKKNPTKPRF